MASNKLNRRKRIIGPPPVCKVLFKGKIKLTKIPPVPGPPDCDTINCFAQWVDLDPARPYQQKAIFKLYCIRERRDYFGRSSPKKVRLEVLAHRHWRIDVWDITLWTYDPGEEREDFMWGSELVDKNKTFDTGMLWNVIIPKRDYRCVRLAL